MAIDKDAIKRKLEHLKNPKAGGGERSKLIWKVPKLGDPAATIRLFQYPFTGGDEPFVETYSHYAELNVLCPKYTSNKPCVICDAVSKLRKTKNKEDDKLAYELYAKPRYFAAMIDRADPTMTPMYWGFSKTNYLSLLEKLVDEEYQNFLDPVNGIDIVVKTDKQPKKKFAEAVFSFKRKESRLAETDADIQKILKGVVPVEEIFKLLSEEEMKVKFDEWMAKGEKTEEASEGNEEVRGGGADKTENNVEDEFRKSFEEAMASADD